MCMGLFGERTGYEREDGDGGWMGMEMEDGCGGNCNTSSNGVEWNGVFVH